MNKKHKAESAPATGRVYYGFTKANREEQPAWFHTPMAAQRFANACWPGSNYLVDTTTAPDPKDIMDTPEKPWYATNQTAEAAPAPSGQHTPGKWIACPTQSCHGSWGVFTEQGRYSLLDGSAPHGRAEANARLMAQAPQLLAENQALKSKIECLKEALTGTLTQLERVLYAKSTDQVQQHVDHKTSEALHFGAISLVRSQKSEWYGDETQPIQYHALKAALQIIADSGERGVLAIATFQDIKAVARTALANTKEAA